MMDKNKHSQSTPRPRVIRPRSWTIITVATTFLLLLLLATNNRNDALLVAAALTTGTPSSPPSLSLFRSGGSFHRRLLLHVRGGGGAHSDLPAKTGEEAGTGTETSNNDDDNNTNDADDDDDGGTVCVVGGGVIGSSFCAVFLARGKSVICSDPYVTQDDVHRRITDVWPTLRARGIARKSKPPFHMLKCDPDLESAITVGFVPGSRVDFVQECTYEDIRNKQKVLGQIDQIADPSTIIASSTSFIPHEILITDCRNNKDRVLVGHPSIPHWDSFMEVYGNPKTSSGYVDRAKRWYTNCGFDTIVMNKTIPGHVFNSFLTMNMGHGSKLVRDGICSPQDVDTVMRHMGRDFYGRHMYLSLMTVIGGERGITGGIELSERIKKGAVSIVFYSLLKKLWLPDRLATSMGNFLSRMLADVIEPPPPPEFIDACREYESKLTECGKVGIPEAFATTINPGFYKRLPYEVDNDPFRM